MKSCFKAKSKNDVKSSSKQALEAKKEDDMALLSPEEMENQAIKDAFSSYDLNKDNKIQKGELREVLKRYYKRAPTERQLGKIMNKVDINNNGVIDYDEFVLMMKERVSTKAEIESTFKEWDKNGDGYISREELSQVLNAVEEHSEEEIDEILRLADMDKDGKINYKEYMDFFM